MKEKSEKIMRIQLVFILLLFLLLLSVFVNINTGSVRISLSEIIRLLFEGPGSGLEQASIIWKIRLPRLIAAALFGGALSVSGFLLQTFFRNPIAGPYVLGISSGAKLFVSITMIVVLNYFSRVPVYAVVLAAFLGSLVSMGFVLLFSQKVKSMSTLLVIGIMIGYICGAVTDFFISFAKESDVVNLQSWSMGSFSGISWASLKISAVLVMLALLAAMMLSKPMYACQLGEDYAASVGINIKLLRLGIILLSSLLSACVTAFAGPISFVGIAVPHMVRMLLNTARPVFVIPASFLGGGAFCLFCDLIARTVFAPTELAIGTVTAVFGAPVVIWLMISRAGTR